MNGQAWPPSPGRSSLPKKCGFFAGKQVIPLEEHVQKIRARWTPAPMPTFRHHRPPCDAYAVTGWEDTVQRCRAYIEAALIWSLWMASRPWRI